MLMDGIVGLPLQVSVLGGPSRRLAGKKKMLGAQRGGGVGPAGRHWQMSGLEELAHPPYTASTRYSASSRFGSCPDLEPMQRSLFILLQGGIPSHAQA
mmetsp:Transcript_62578/g.123658  ORF Transcript_62578/g.123658 Transcript_62578/m.123658 type:complete len:98 (+) Transcript_62578:199-492(+)